MPSINVFSYFPFGFKGGMWDLIVSVPDHCLSFYFTGSTATKEPEDAEQIANSQNVAGKLVKTTKGNKERKSSQDNTWVKQRELRQTELKSKKW